MTADSAEEEPSAKMLKCSHCPKEFRYNSEKNRHELSHSPRFECEVCCKKFSFVSALRRHQKQHERTGSVKCEECKRTFRDEVLLKRHMKYAHKGTVTCSKCSSLFSSDQALLTHMKSHKPVSERRFKCSFEGCRKSFNFSHHLKHHELTHTNAKQHYCSVCGKGFIQSHHLKTHLKSHDPSEWLNCEVSGCKKNFTTEYARRRHMATHKIKPDSGISSDSSSCDNFIFSKEYVEDSILCASCGEDVPPSDYAIHSVKCGDILDISTNMAAWSISQAKQGTVIEKVSTPKPMFDKDVSDCKSALGGCICASNCVCEQMTKSIDESYDFVPIGNSNGSTMESYNDMNMYDTYAKNDFKSIDVNRNYTNSFRGFDYANKAVLKNDVVNQSLVGLKNNEETFNYPRNNMSSKCEGCDCVRNCNVREPSNCSYNTNKDTVSNVEYRIDGVVKIKDTFDIDIPIKVEPKPEPQEFVPFGSCRDVIGNCLAGGSEGCLCARMMIDEQQEMAQEIDDITPKPKTEKYSML